MSVMLRKLLFNDDNFQKHKLKPYHRRDPKTLKLHPQTWYVNEKFLVIVGCYISLEMS